ncbi:hypothetical protein WN943_017550 [Citrus x changshan-huyou]
MDQLDSVSAYGQFRCEQLTDKQIKPQKRAAVHVGPRKPSTKSSSVTDANYHRRPIIAGDPTPDRSIESAKGHDCLPSVFFW